MLVANMVSGSKWVLVCRIQNSSMNGDFLLQLSGVESTHKHAQSRRGGCLLQLCWNAVIAPQSWSLLAALQSPKLEDHSPFAFGILSQGQSLLSGLRSPQSSLPFSWDPPSYRCSLFSWGGDLFLIILLTRERIIFSKREVIIRLLLKNSFCAW